MKNPRKLSDGEFKDSIDPLTLAIMKAMEPHHPDIKDVMISLMYVMSGTLVQFPKSDRQAIREWALECLEIAGKSGLVD
jgi:hypothetical protein